MDDIFVCKNSEEFIPGLKLNRGFYFDVIKPLIDKKFPNLNYAAALIGHCSDVLGFDDYKSTDHVWGPRLQIFLQEKDFQSYHNKLDELFKYNLPFKYKGFPTNYKAVEGWFNNAYMQFTKKYPINHFIEIVTVKSFFNRDISFDIDSRISFSDWMSYPIQNLLELTSGEVFYDGIGELTKARKKLKFYPRDIILLKIFFLWTSINEEQAFVGRCIENRDMAGAMIIISRILNKFMKLCFYYEKKYYPYSKWFGLAFKKLDIYTKAQSIIEKIASVDVEDKMGCLNDFYIEIVSLHNAINITEPVKSKIIDYYNRGYKGFDSERVIEKIRYRIDWDKIKNLELLSRVELFDDSYYGVSYEINRSIIE